MPPARLSSFGLRFVIPARIAGQGGQPRKDPRVYAFKLKSSSFSTGPTSKGPSTTRAIFFREHGPPAETLEALTYDLPALQPDEVRVRLKLSAVNPADINVVEGSYPSQPVRREGIDSRGPISIPGSEALGVIEQVGNEATQNFKPGDWVIMAASQQGTWMSRTNLPCSKVLNLRRSASAEKPLTEVEAATLAINPPTAYRMLKDFAKLGPGDWVIQNGANSTVGLAVIALAKEFGYKTINVVRDKPDSELESLRRRLHDIGATHVVTTSELGDKAIKQRVAKWTAGESIKLGLNCVSGPSTTSMGRLLGRGAHLVTYGAMSKQPLSLPSSLFIFKDLRSVGFWMSSWYSRAPAVERDDMISTLVKLYEEGKLSAPPTHVVELGGEDQNDHDLAHAAREAMKHSTTGSGKVLFKFL